jgi:hypothetical protein
VSDSISNFGIKFVCFLLNWRGTPITVLGRLLDAAGSSGSDGTLPAYAGWRYLVLDTALPGVDSIYMPILESNLFVFIELAWYSHYSPWQAPRRGGK